MKCLAVVLALAACGDNSQVCGPGTVDMLGVCVAAPRCGPGTMDTGDGRCAPAPTVCAEGTLLDSTTQQCTLDPAACQGGTVLVASQCVDPTSQLAIDLEESAEPNGLGLLGETSTTPAGIVALPAIGAAPYVVHGHITPTQDRDGDGQLDPDIDAYQIHVVSPTYIGVTVIGLGGLAGGFLAVDQVAAGDPLAAWQRIGAELAGATSRRDLYLPSEGTYAIGIADQRTLQLPGVAAGSATAEYFATFEQLAVPAPTPLALSGMSASASGTIGETPTLYAINLPTSGTASVDLAIAPRLTKGSVVVTTSGQTLVLADADTTGHADATWALPAGTTTTIVVDDVSSYALAPAAFTLSVAVTP